MLRGAKTTLMELLTTAQLMNRPFYRVPSERVIGKRLSSQGYENINV